MGWNFKDGAPIWQQIVLTIRTQIARGEWPPGSRIPAVRELAMEAGVNPNTMQRALSELERDHLLYSERTSGRYVTENVNTLNQMREQLGREHVQELFEKMTQLGLSPDQITQAVAAEARRQNSSGRPPS